MKYGAVVFDLDGTLTDSQPGITRCVSYAMETLGKPQLPDHILHKFLGPPLAQSFALYAGLSAEETLEATRLYRKRYADIGWRENRVYPGVRRLLQALRNQGAFIGVATGKLQEASVEILRYFDLDRYIDDIRGPGKDEYHITKDVLIDRVLKGRKDAVMIGDRDSDLHGAAAYGIDNIGVMYGYGDRDEILHAKPAAWVDSAEGLYEALDVKRERAKPFFLSIEGNDGVGKTTQTRALHERLTNSGYQVRLTREPGGSPIAEKIRDMLLNTENAEMSPQTEALLYAAARAQHVQDVIAPALSRGEIVLCDRYVDSSIAYQGGGRDLGKERVEDINRFATGGLMPGLTILLTMDPLAALARRVKATGSDRIEQMNDAFHQRVQHAFAEMPALDPDRIVPIDALGTPEEVSARVYAVVQKRLMEEGIA